MNSNIAEKNIDFGKETKMFKVAELVLKHNLGDLLGIKCIRISCLIIYKAEEERGLCCLKN